MSNEIPDSAPAAAPARGVNPQPAPPTLASWAGGRDRIGELTHAFYQRVPKDPILAPVFAAMDPRHAAHVADFIAEVFGDASRYTQRGGSHAGMIAKHMGRNLTEAQRKRWFDLMLETVDAIGLPADPEFRAALVGYFEWGTRLAVINSKDGVERPADDMPMPRWGWGPPGGPWQP